MKQAKLFILCFVLFLLQGTVLQVFSPSWFGYDFVAVPRFIIIAVLLIGWFNAPSLAVRYAVFFGFLIDIIYTNVWGVYAFCIALTGYIISSLNRILHTHLIILFFLGLIAVGLVDFEVYGVYTLLGKTSDSILTYIKWHLAPTLILNGVFTIIVYYPFKKLLESMKIDQTES